METESVLALFDSAGRRHQQSDVVPRCAEPEAELSDAASAALGERRRRGGLDLGLAAGGMTLPEDWKEHAELMDLTSHLEFLTSNRAENFKRQCVARIEGFIAKFNRTARTGIQETK